MRLPGNLTFAGLGQIQNLRVENRVEDPANPSSGQVWYNTTDGVYRGFDGTDVITFASGGNTQLIVDEINAVENAAGLEADGSYLKHTDTNYINDAATLKAADKLLDAQIKLNADAVATAGQGLTALGTEVNAIETGIGLNADGTYTAPAGSNYIGTAVDIKGALVALDTRAKTNTDAIEANVTAIDGKVSKAGDTLTGNLAFGGTSRVTGLANAINPGDAINKSQFDNALAGLTWENPVSKLVADHTAIATALELGDRIVNTTSNKIFTVTTAGANGAAAVFDGGEQLVDGAAFFDKTDETGYVFNGVEIVQFTGGGQLTAGVGLVKNGNVLDVNLGAGIGQLPTDEVGIDVLAAGGLFLTEDGSTDSVGTAAQLSVKLDGATLARSAAGVKISAAGVTAVEISASVAGNGIQGGAGTALSVKADSGITVSADGVKFDTTFGDARYATLTGATYTGPVVLAADPVVALGAATKQMVDALAAKVAAGTFVYDGSVSAASHVVTHNLGSKYANVTVVDSADKVIIPDSVTFDSENQLTVGFSSAITCKVVVSATKA